MKTDYALLFMGGVSGTGAPPSLKITNPFEDLAPVVAPFNRGKFGTHTSAFGLAFGKMGWFIDNGSGIGHVASYLTALKVDAVYGFESHKHADHRIGIQSNMLLFRKDLVKGLFTPKLGKKSSAELMAVDFNTDRWPISPKKLGIEHIFKEFEPGETLDAFIQVKTMMLPHPGGAVAYSFGFPHGKIIIATDAELVAGELREVYAGFVSGARYLYVDMQYRDAEYEGKIGICGGPAMSRVGWGHSTPRLLKETLERCPVLPQTILIGHHEPSRTDEDLCQFEAETRDYLSSLGVEVAFAREGESFELGNDAIEVNRLDHNV